MRMQSKNPATLFCILIALFLLAACTGINGRQLSLDPVFTEIEKIEKAVLLDRSEFSQLKKEYVLTLQEVHFDRMNELMRRTREQLEMAEYFQKNYKYYRKGIDYERWKIAVNTNKLCRKTLCEMMLDTGELEMLYADQEKAAALFTAVVTEFKDEDYSGYVAQAKDFLQVIEEETLYTSLTKEAKLQVD